MRRALFISAVVAVPLCGLTGTASGQCGPGTFTKIAESGHVVGSTSFSGFTSHPTINQSGTVAFHVLMANGQRAIYKGDGTSLTLVVSTASFGTTLEEPNINNAGEVCFRNNSGVHKGSGGPITTIATVAGGFFSPSSTQVPDIDDSGRVVFVAASPVRLAIGSGGPVTVLADTSASSPVSGISNVAISNNGTVIFTGGLKSGGGGLHEVPASGDGSITTLIQTGSGQLLQPISLPAINDHGHIAFNAFFNSGAAALHTYFGGVLTTLVTSVGPFHEFNYGSSPVSPSINNHGQISFSARLDNGTFGVYNGTDPVLNKVIERGDALDGSTVATSGSFPLSTGTQAINDAGQIVFKAILADGRSGIYRYEPGGTSQPPTCLAGGPYVAECQGESTQVALDGSASSDPDDCPGPLTHAWSSDCPGASFDDATSATPVLTVDTSCACTVSCSVTLTVDDGDSSETCITTVTISDNASPIIALNGESTVTLECGHAYTELGAGASDACDSSLTSATVGGDTVDSSTPGAYVVTYDATDASGNAAAQVTRTVTVEDTAAPIIALNGPSEVTLECHVDSYAEPGATVFDDCDASIAVTVGGDTVDATTPGTYVVTYDAQDAAGNAAATVTRTVIVQDTLPPDIAVDTTPIVVVDADCSGGEAVAIPPASASDLCHDSLPVANDAPAVFPAGETTIVTYSATDASGNTGTAQVEVTVLNGADIRVNAGVQYVGPGSHPGATLEPLAGILVGAYDLSTAGCAQQQSGGPGVTFHHYPAIFANCTPAATAVTDAGGDALLNVPSGDYLILSYVDTDSDSQPDTFIAARANQVHCEDLDVKNLRLIVNTAGKAKPGKTTKLTGSELLIIEPEYVIWDQSEQLYPFVFESRGTWGVVATVAPPEGFVSDYDELSAEVIDEIKAVQFTIVEVGSDLVPTQTVFAVTHSGRQLTVESNVGILLTEDYARSRGFNTARLRARGLIAERNADGGSRR